MRGRTLIVAFVQTQVINDHSDSVGWNSFRHLSGRFDVYNQHFMAVTALEMYGIAVIGAGFFIFIEYLIGPSTVRAATNLH
jgi:hypothetical protein